MAETTLQKFEKEASEFPARAKMIIVHDEKTLIIADGFVKGIKAMRKEIKDFFKPLKEKAKATHQALVDQEKKYDMPLINAEDEVKLQITGYMAEQERIEKEAEEKAAREEEERQRIEDEKVKEAEALEREGHEEAAEKIIEEIPLPELYIPPEAPKLEGISIRKIPKWEVENFKLIPRVYLMVDSAKITQAVKSTKGRVRIPGIKVYFESNVAVKA